MRLVAGRLRHRVTFDEPVVTQDATGSEVSVWTPRFTVWGSVEPLTGREALNANQILSTINTKIKILWSQTADEIKPTWRARFDGAVYDLQSVAHKAHGRREIEILAKSGAAAES